MVLILHEIVLFWCNHICCALELLTVPWAVVNCAFGLLIVPPPLPTGLHLECFSLLQSGHLLHSLITWHLKGFSLFPNNACLYWESVPTL